GADDQDFRLGWNGNHGQVLSPNESPSATSHSVWHRSSTKSINGANRAPCYQEGDAENDCLPSCARVKVEVPAFLLVRRTDSTLRSSVRRKSASWEARRHVRFSAVERCTPCSYTERVSALAPSRFAP